MKKWIACALSVCLCLTPLLACAQPVSTESLLAQLLLKLAQQMQTPAFRAVLEEDGSETEICLTLDEQGIPDFEFTERMGGEEVSFDADASGLRIGYGEEKYGVTPDTLWRALTTDEHGGSHSPDVQEADVELLMQIAGEIVSAAMGAVSTTEIAPIQALKNAAEEPVQTIRQTKIDVNMLLAALDQAIPAALDAHGDALNALIARNRAFLASFMDVSSLPDMHALAGAWPQGLLSSLIPDEKIVITAVCQGNEQAFSVEMGDVEIARVFSEPERTWGSLGVNGEWAFDSADLSVLMQLAQKLPAYISDQAMSWHYFSQNGNVSAHLRVETEQLVKDVVVGAAGIVRSHRQEIEGLMDRYIPWLVLFGMTDAEAFTWEKLYAALHENQDRIISNIYNQMIMKAYRFRSLRQVFGTGLPWLEMNLNISSSERRTDIVWDLATQDMSAALTIGGGAISGSYMLGRQMTDYGSITGFAVENRAQLIFSHQTKGKTVLRCTLDAQKDSEGWTVLAQGTDGANTREAQLRITPQWMQLTSGSLTANLIDTGVGFALDVCDGTSAAHADWYLHDGVWSASLYINGEEIRGYYAKERDVEILNLTQRVADSRMSRELKLQIGEESLMLRAGRSYAGVLRPGVELNLQLSKELPKLDMQIFARAWDFRTEYLPGEMSMDFVDGKGQWSMKLQDATTPETDGNITQIRVDTKQTIEKETVEKTYGYRISTVPGAQLWTVQITGDEGESTALALDFAAAATAQDLSGYTWLTEEQVRDAIAQMMAEPTPAPTLTPAQAPMENE